MNSHDPRPDLTADTVAWSWLLRFAYPGKDVADDGLYHALRDLRNLGAALVTKDGAYRLAAGAMDPTEYRLYRVKWLWPHTDRIVALLAKLRDVEPEEQRML